MNDTCIANKIFFKKRKNLQQIEQGEHDDHPTGDQHADNQSSHSGHKEKGKASL
jgi:hypothetical protein